MKKTAIILPLIFMSLLGYAQNETAPAQPAKKRVGNIQAGEADKYRQRFEAKDSKYFSFGPGFGTNVNNTQVLYAFTFGYEWEVGAQGALLAEAFGAFGDGTAIGDGSIGGKYFFSDEDASPFLKATFGMGLASAKGEDSVTGFSGKVGAGMTFFRTSTKHLEVSANYATIFKSNKEGNPGVFVFALTLLY